MFLGVGGGTGGGRGVTKPVSEGTSSQYEKVKISHKNSCRARNPGGGLPNSTAYKPPEKETDILN